MKRKLFSLCIALVMLFVTTVPAFATSTSDDIITDLEERTWINGNGETLVLPPIDVSENSYIPPIIPEGTDPEDLISLPTASPNSVIGTDTRTPVNNPMNYPNSPIAELKLEFGPLTTYYGTGFLVAPNLLLTAGHNIVHQVFGSCTKITVMFGGRNSNGWRFTITPGSNTYTPIHWNEDFNVRHDFAIIRLPNNVGNSLGTLALQTMGNSELPLLKVRITGFPQDKPAGSMWYDIGTIREVEALLIHHDVATYSSNSGSPVLLASNNSIVIGVHTYGRPQIHPDYNSATRVTSTVIAAVNRMK